METQRHPNIAISPETGSTPKHGKLSRSRPLSVEERIAIIFKCVPKELRPRFSLSDHFYSMEEVASAPPLLSLPRALIPKRGRETPPYLHYGLPISLEKMTSLARSREPTVEIIIKLGFVSLTVRQLAAKCLSEEIGWPVYLERVLNAPNTPFAVCLIENHTVEERQKTNEFPTRDHIRRMQKALEVGPEARPLWYIAAGFYTWQYHH
ncbi:hypothetical protein HETIRDRAFT_318084 [Heterobasidion irregulare TC 32-1]|uniref:Uncharacterized protein n=1 Tax=Heterobasidion irregulare (strain TC 32-1) TaxID=747525 RepID=W4K6E5_HETIT|nr:uncharacterized protein HETIRDRAFT_318084 [Heterobasidion irregulare TC 32-1]ETW81309.1 hypothetical protein HETIRDRAFT_318084 [Heterobasidion irregulare TC 32-1]